MTTLGGFALLASVLISLCLAAASADISAGDEIVAPILVPTDLSEPTDNDLTIIPRILPEMGTRRFVFAAAKVILKIASVVRLGVMAYKWIANKVQAKKTGKAWADISTTSRYQTLRKGSRADFCFQDSRDVLARIAQELEGGGAFPGVYYTARSYVVEFSEGFKCFGDVVIQDHALSRRLEENYPDYVIPRLYEMFTNFVLAGRHVKSHWRTYIDNLDEIIQCIADENDPAARAAHLINKARDDDSRRRRRDAAADAADLEEVEEDAPSELPDSWWCDEKKYELCHGGCGARPPACDKPTAVTFGCPCSHMKVEEHGICVGQCQYPTDADAFEVSVQWKNEHDHDNQKDVVGESSNYYLVVSVVFNVVLAVVLGLFIVGCVVAACCSRMRKRRKQAMSTAETESAGLGEELLVGNDA